MLLKKLYFTFCFIFLINFSHSQISIMFQDDFNDSIHSNKIGISFDAAYNSNAITNEFSQKFYKGGYISSNLKDFVSYRLKNNNRIGGDLNYGVYGTFKLDSLFPKKDLSLFVAVKDRTHFDSRFSKDLYKIGFYGNSSYAGETAYFNDFNFNLLRYQQIQVGLFSSKLDSAAHWGIGISFLKGEQFLNVLAQKAELFTSQDGQYIDFNTDFYVAKSDTAKKGINAFNGFGSCVDIYFEAPFNTKFGPSKIKASISDVGFINFNKQSITMHQDSLFHYDGYTINSIYDLQDSTINNFNQDSIINGIAPIKKQSISATLPAILNLSFETQFSKHFRLQEGIRYVYNANYKLMIYLKGNIYFNQNMMLSLTAAHGGYGTFNYGIGFNARIGKSIIFNIGSNNIEGFFIPKETNGLSTYGGLSFSF